MVAVAISGILAAVGVPIYTDNVRNAKAAEVHVSLDRCHRSVLAYFQATKSKSGGEGLADYRLPKNMNPCICPGKKYGKDKDLSGNSAFFDPAVFEMNGARAFSDIGFVMTEASYACYTYKTNTKKKSQLVDGDWFRCQAMTDLDNDDQFAYWYKTATYRAATGSFQSGFVYHLEGQDDW